VLDQLRRSTAAGLASPLRFLLGGGDPDHSFVHGGRFVGDDPYVPLYERIALWLIASEAVGQSDHGPPALRLKMGDLLERCGNQGEVALVHSNCLLAVASEDHVRIVKEFYTEAARSAREEILNPVCYPDELTDHVHPDCMVRSYGCGSPVLDAKIAAGESVVDLGCGTGVECLIASRMVGETGRVVGIDMLEPMLALARKGAEGAASKLGYANVAYEQARLESLPLEDGSADVVLSNCVVNLSHHKRRTFAETFRVLKPGGRLVVSDVVCDHEPSSSIRHDEILRGECIAGALTQRDLVGILEEAGFASFRILKRFPYRVVRGHPFYSLTFEAKRPLPDRSARVLYRGPFAAVLTRDGELLTPGAVCEVAASGTLDDPEQLLELDAGGQITNADLGSSACECGVPPAEAVAAGDESSCGGPAAAPVTGCDPAPPRRHASGCMSCGAPLDYGREEREVDCVFCGKPGRSSVLCRQGHFVCDACHLEDGVALTEQICLHTDQTDMLSLLQSIRAHDAIPMHGPEHHAMVAGIILATYRNRGGDLTDEQIRSGIRRGATVPGGACGFMGSCGAAVGVGIAFGVILGSSPLVPAARRTLQAATSAVLAEIGKLEAARCCQRECFVALTKAAELSRTLLPVSLEAKLDLECAQMHLNDECVGAACPIFDPEGLRP